MRLLDRLDAIDRRLGIVRPDRVKPPTRGSRWFARHRLVTALLVALPVAATWLVGALLVDEGVSPVVAMLQTMSAFALGFFVATVSRRHCEAWDQRPEA